MPLRPGKRPARSRPSATTRLNSAPVRSAAGRRPAYASSASAAARQLAGRPAVARDARQRVDGCGLMRSLSCQFRQQRHRLLVVAGNRRQRGDRDLAEHRREVAAEPHRVNGVVSGQPVSRRDDLARAAQDGDVKRAAARLALREVRADDERVDGTFGAEIEFPPRIELARREGRGLAGLRDVGVAVERFAAAAAEVAAGDTARLAGRALWRDVHAAAEHLDLCQPQRAFPAGQQDPDVAAVDGRQASRLLAS